MLQKFILPFCLASSLSIAPGMVSADTPSSNKWVDISQDKNLFDKNCDYKVWVLEDKKWSETWYLEAFDAENAFYTINRQSSVWNDRDDFYALNYNDKTKFLIGENFVEVVPFALCLPTK